MDHTAPRLSKRAPLALILFALALGLPSRAIPPRARAQEPEPSGLAPVAERVRAHADADALALLAALPAEERGRPALAYLRGRLLERQGDMAGAAGAFSFDAAGLPEPLRVDYAFRRGRALLRSGYFVEALPFLAGPASGTDGRAALARALAAEARLEAEQLDAAVRALRAVAREDARDVDSFAVRLELADALIRSGQSQAAGTELHALLVDRPAHPQTALAIARLRELGLTVDFSRAEHLARADHLARLGRHEQAYEELVAAGEGATRSERSAWLHTAGMELYRARRYTEAQPLLSRAARVTGPTQTADALHAARALARSDQDTKAIRAFHQIVRRWPRAAEAAEAEYLGAWLELRHGGRLGAAHMRAFLSGPRGHVSGANARAASWHLAMDGYRHRRYAAAADLFAEYARSGSGAMVNGRGQYWQARALEQAHDSRAQAIYGRVHEAYPLHWYGVLAAARLRALGVEVAAPYGVALTSMPASDETRATSAPLAGTPLASSSLAEEIHFYARLGLVEDAVDALRARESSLRQALGSDWRRDLTETYLGLGEISRPYQLSVATWQESASAPRPEDAWLWNAAWPRPHRAAVSVAAQAEQLDPALLYAVMRQESGYNPHALSPAGAMGLLQVMPHAGARVAASLGVPFDAQRLYDPTENVRLGAAEVAHVLELFDGDIPLALAAYNAGTARVRQWLERTGAMDLDLFVEEIPFDETRNYVRRVTGHLVVYRYIEDPAHGWALSVPERVPAAPPGG